MAHASAHPGKFYVNAAKDHGLTVRQGAGDHVVVYAPRMYRDLRPMVVPLHKELARGTEHSIRNWFKLIGIILALGVVIACLAPGFLGVH